MKIAIFTWGLQNGAFANVAAALANGFCSIGRHDVYILYLFQGPGENVSIRKRVHLKSFEVHHSLYSIESLRKFLKAERPNVLITMPAIVNLPSVVAYLLSHTRVSGTKLIVTEHAIMSHEAYSEHQYNPKNRFQPQLARTLYPRADALVANSEVVLNDLLNNLRINMKGKPTAFIPNPADIDRIKRLSSRIPEHPWFSTKDVPVVLSVGMLGRQKNFSITIESI